MRLKLEILNQYKPLDENKIDVMLQEKIQAWNKKWVVLDDDPTGVQTVHDISVYTDWSEDSMRKAFKEPGNLFYILTNSRGFTEEQTIKAHREIAKVIRTVAEECGKDYKFISRSDSTLRGYYPLETEILRQEIEKNTDIQLDGEIMCPFFPEGGRYTIDDVHYVRMNEELVPADETEFAKDKTFGYHSANMKEYIEEKTKGKFKAEDVVSISLTSIRNMDIEGITEQLQAVKDFDKVIVNAVSYVDVKVFCIALYNAMQRGKNFMFRTAAGFVKVAGGISDQPLLTRNQMIHSKNDHGGIVVVGSYTEKTTAQLEKMKELENVRFIELNSDLVEDKGALDAEVERVVALEERYIADGQTVVVYTKRKQMVELGDTKESILLRSVRISDAVQSLVGKLNICPAFVVAKGGITSNDVGTKALKVKRADVMGQIAPGIPVWKTGLESRFPEIPYIIFPGNVGEISTLKEVVEILMG